jgi:glycosyltransferase involved in cell wall biosynthesis
VSDERLQELYLNALGVYYGPFDEDYGYVTLEGFAAHRPVVTLTDAGGPLEFVVDHETGLVVPPEPEAIGHAFDVLFSNRPKAKAMGEEGHIVLQARVPGWPEVVARLTE